MPLSSTLGTLLALQDALARAQDDDFFGFGTTSRGAFPPICVFKNEEGFVVRAEIPGADKSKLNIEVSNDLLRISGERAVNFDKKEVSIHRAERLNGRFDRMVRLPDILDSNKVRADYQNGILLIHLPQSEESKPRKISIG